MTLERVNLEDLTTLQADTQVIVATGARCTAPTCLVQLATAPG
jgi:hypothetical protein